ncbi:MAG TPA: protein translocase subunit SecD [Acidimicrobiales bacterium]|nr:protein translocase subunit SecD [Acidimicrobiales bacterium]
MRRGTVGSLIAIVVIALGAFVATLAVGNSPQLGLDLQGGTSVVLQPKDPATRGVLNQSIEIIRNRVDALGVAEPDISRLGDNIVVQLPGVKDADRALEIVGQTAELRFRPVVGELPPENAPPPTTSSTAPADPAATTTTTMNPATVPTTTREEDLPDKPVVLPELDEGRVVRRYQLGAAEMTGRAVATARANFTAEAGQWAVDFELTGEGAEQFDAMAAKYLQRQIAIVLDGVVQSAPVIQQADFNGKGQISGDFTEREAKDLALVLRYGALPVELEPQSTQRVSASLGKDSLRAGIIAGLAGLALVLLYMVLYYRALGLVVLFGLTIWGTLMWTIVSFLGETSGLALSLSGAVGIIISVGVTVDSYVVYFERLKDEIRSGKTIRSSVDRGFSRAFRTILAADIASFIGAALLFILTVGSVRGFAFFLGLSTLLDVVVAWFFTRPLVVLLGRNRLFTEARWLGVARGLAATPAGGAS